MENEFVIFEDNQYVLKRSTYAFTNQTRLDLMQFDPVIGNFEPFMTATKEVENADITEDEVVIKNYSENLGILQALIKAEIISKSHESVSSGFVKLNICQLIR